MPDRATFRSVPDIFLSQMELQKTVARRAREKFDNGTSCAYILKGRCRGWGLCTMHNLRESKALVVCPGCDQPMKAIDYKPIMFSNGLADVTYRCEICQMTTIRTVRQDDDKSQ
jgi:hypothetical protein